MVNANQETGNILPEINYLLTYEQMNTLITFEKLWTELSMWLRSLIVSITGNLGNKEAVTNQLFSIPSDFYNVFRVFYGPVISQKFLNLLSNFVTNIWMLIEALNNDDKEGVDSSTVQLYQNADELAKFLSQINVYWDESQWKYLLYQFIRLLIDEVVATLAGNYEQEIIIFNRLDDITDIMGSYMARGIIARSINNEREATS